MSADRVSADDLEFAATWLEAYDGAAEDGTLDDNDYAARRVAAWLRAEAQRRYDRAVVTRVVRETGVSREQARAGLARIRQREGLA